MAGLDYGALIGAGLGLGSAALVGQQANRANQLSQQNSQRLFDLAAQEQARKDSLTRAFLPSVMFGMGSHNPVGSAQKAYPTTLPTSGSGQFQTPNPYGQQQSGGGPGIGSALMSAGATAAPLIAKGVGIGTKALTAGAGPWSANAGVGAGGGAAHGIGAFMTNPWTAAGAGAAIGTAALVKSQAHWEANDIVKNLQNPYHQKVLAPLSEGVASGKIPPQQAVAELDRTWAEYQQQLAAFAKKGSDGQKVAQQSYNTLAPLIAQMRADMLKQGGGQ